MERLTERYKDSIANTVLIRECGDKLCKNICDDIEYDCSKCELEKALDKLATYEDLEEQGLLVRLPCKIGDTVYRVNVGAKQPIIPMTVSEIHFLCYKNERTVRFDAIGKEDMGESCYRLEDIGRIVVRTREEAEKKLEEKKAND